MEFEKYHKIRIIGDLENKDILSNPEDEIVIEEKIDGANFRVYVHGDKVIFGSRTSELDGEALRQKQFTRAINSVRKKLEDYNDRLLFPIILYMENCVKHSLNYNWDEIPSVLGFDIKTEEGYLDYATKCDIFNKIGITVVPLIRLCKAKDITILDESIVPESFYASPSSTDKRCEGVVIKNYSKQLFAKLVRTKFKEVNHEAFGMNKKYADNDNEKLVAVYCTNARIDKVFFKLIDEGNEVGMELTGDLIKRVWKDIIEEKAVEILYQNWNLNIRDCRKLIAKRCLTVLKNIIQNNALNEVEK